MTPPIDQSSGRRVPGRTRRIAVAIVVGVTVLGVCVAVAVSVLTPIARRSSDVSSYWSARLERDYPGWKVVGFRLDTFPRGDDTVTRYDFDLVPLRREFSVGVSYLSVNGGEAMSQDYILKPQAMWHDRSRPLLAFLQAVYVENGATVARVTSDTEGRAAVDWLVTRRVGPFTQTKSGHHRLEFDEPYSSWDFADGPED